ncbi:spherulation-specific family 4 protein [Isosphaeraceae bacterium EP7]
MKLLVPAYFYPAGKSLDDWERIFKGALRTPLTIIANPNSGPGETEDANYLAVIHRAASSQIAIAGYVDTGYAKRPTAEVRADIEKWIRFYPEIGGIFLDSQSPRAEHVDYYAALRTFVAEKISRGFVITNPGTTCAEEYFSRPATDVACVFASHEPFDNFRLPATWSGRYPSKNFAAIPYGIEGEAAMRGSIRQAASGHLGYIYVSDAKSPNPWDHLPRYWEAEVDAVRRVNQRQAP